MRCVCLLVRLLCLIAASNFRTGDLKARLYAYVLYRVQVSLFNSRSKARDTPHLLCLKSNFRSWAALLYRVCGAQEGKPMFPQASPYLNFIKGTRIFTQLAHFPQETAPHPRRLEVVRRGSRFLPCLWQVAHLASVPTAPVPTATVRGLLVLLFAVILSGHGCLRWR